MPETTAPPAPATSDNPPGSYNPANQPRVATVRQPPPGMTEALTKLAGSKPGAPVTAQPSTVVTPGAFPQPAPPKPNPKADPSLVPHVEPPMGKPKDQEPPRRFQAPDTVEPPTPAPAKSEPMAKPAQVAQPAKPAAAPDVEPATPPADTITPEIRAAAPKLLREAYDKLKDDFAARAAEGEMTKKELADYRAKAKSYEDRIKALEAANGRAKELEKQVLSYDEQLRVTNYLQHPEFHEKYVKPVAEAMQSAHALVRDLVVEQDDGTQRMGTEEDFAAVLAQPNTTLANRKAKELFGDLAQSVVMARQTVIERQRAQQTAIKEAGLRSQEWVKTRAEREAAARTAAREQFQRIDADLQAKYPGLYTPPADDKEAIAVRKEGEQLASLILEGPTPDMTQESLLTTTAKLYNRAASWPVLHLRLQRLEAELATTRERLSAYEGSTPDINSVKSSGGNANMTPGATDDPRTLLRKGLEAIAGKGGRR